MQNRLLRAQASVACRSGSLASRRRRHGPEGQARAEDTTYRGCCVPPQVSVDDLGVVAEAQDGALKRWNRVEQFVCPQIPHLRVHDDLPAEPHNTVTRQCLPGLHCTARQGRAAAYLIAGRMEAAGRELRELVERMQAICGHPERGHATESRGIAHLRRRHGRKGARKAPRSGVEQDYFAAATVHVAYGHYPVASLVEAAVPATIESTDAPIIQQTAVPQHDFRTR
eukprot:scaffold1218_cov393-Prasinococcus_capsulatus_cf.AAC.2